MAAATLMSSLREMTHEAHDHLESLPYFQALVQGTLPIESYVGHLRAMAVLHSGLERVFTNAQDARLKVIWNDTLRRFPRLQEDLKHFAPLGVHDIPASASAGRALVDLVMRRSIEAPWSLLGYLYVLEGSIGGARVLAPRFGEAFGLDERHGLAYLTWDPAVAAARWPAFTAAMNALELDAAERDAIILAACEAFSGIRRVFDALYPFQVDDLDRIATTLNPEAGDHPVPKDPVEMDAALRTAARCWAEYPYLAMRFGERGWRYTQSDGAWLATLVAQEQVVVDSQIEWLGGILASRGMPRLLLQRHLELLYDDLREQVGEHPEYARLLVAADHLAEQRRAVLTEADLSALATRFDEAIGPEWCERLPWMGWLVGCAVADRAHGIEASVTSLVGWLTDPQRFPPHWIAAVQAAQLDAEAHLR